MDKKIDVESLAKDIEESFNKLAGDMLELSEGYFKNGVDNKKWSGYRKLNLDLINIHKRYILSKLEGRNYYHFTVRKEGNNE